MIDGEHVQVWPPPKFTKSFEVQYWGGQVSRFWSEEERGQAVALFNALEANEEKRQAERHYSPIARFRQEWESAANDDEMALVALRALGDGNSSGQAGKARVLHVIKCYGLTATRGAVEELIQEPGGVSFDNAMKWLAFRAAQHQEKAHV
jgi:hypothetical protein